MVLVDEGTVFVLVCTESTDVCDRIDMITTNKSLDDPNYKIADALAHVSMRFSVASNIDVGWRTRKRITSWLQGNHLSKAKSTSVVCTC